MALTAHDILMDADLFRAAYPGWPMTGPQLVSYPESLDAPRTEGTPSGTARRMASLLRQGQERDDEEG
jgi:hypothetical protein